LLNEGFRYRDLDTGTFITRDPLGFKAGPNNYTYVEQNPWTHFDPEGLVNETAQRLGLSGHGLQNLAPDPVGDYHATQASANKMVHGSGVIEHTTGALGVIANGIFFALDFEGVGGFAKSAVKGIGEGLAKTFGKDAAKTTSEDVTKAQAKTTATTVDKSQSKVADTKPAPPNTPPSKPPPAPSTPKPPPNPHGSPGAPDHQEANKQLITEMQERHPDATITSNKSIKPQTGIDRKPDAAAIKDDKVVEVGEVARTNKDNKTLVSRERKKQAQYEKAKIPSTVKKLPYRSK
jgi:uncharacterized protein RhaS with RHS repeats